MAVSSIFPANLKRIRKDKRIRQDALASNLGVSQAHVSKMESGEKMPSLPVLVHMAEILECTVDDLVKVPELKNNQ